MFELHVDFYIMASNYVVSVPKLKGRENYSEWCFAAENFLVLEGMLDTSYQAGAW